MSLKDQVTKMVNAPQKVVAQTRQYVKDSVPKEDMFSGVSQYSGDDLSNEFLASQRKAPGLDSFKSTMRQNVDLNSFDNEIKSLKDRKSALYADMIKHADKYGYQIDPANVREKVGYEADKIDMQIKNIDNEMKGSLKDLDKEAEYQYKNLSDDLFKARSRQMELETQLDNELIKPKSDPEVIQDLRERKEKIDKNYEGIKKQFNKYGVKQPEIILRKYADEEKSNAKEEKNTIDSTMRDLAFGQYSSKDGQIDTKSFLKSLQKDPEYTNLSPEETAKKLLDEQADDDTIKDVGYIAYKLAPSGESFVDIMNDKGYIDEDLSYVVLSSYLENDPSWDTEKINELIDGLRSYGIDRGTVKDVLKNHGLTVNRKWEVEEE